MAENQIANRKHGTDRGETELIETHPEARPEHNGISRGEAQVRESAANSRPTPSDPHRLNEPGIHPTRNDQHRVPALDPSEPSLGALFSSLSDDFTSLMRKEVELAAAEIQENAKRAMRAGIMLAVAGFLAYAGLILLLIAAGIGLGNALNSLWMGFGIVGLVVVVIAAILFATGKSKVDDVELAPNRAIKSVEKDIEMVQEKLS